jgi:hypothetical protein
VYFRPSHQDPSHAPYTFSWTVAREPDSRYSPHPDPLPTHTLRTRGYSPPLVAENPKQWPAYGGGNFIDTSLKVKVIQAPGTLLAHRPEFMHGTSRLCGTRVCGMTIPFTLRVKEQFDKMVALGTHVMESSNGDNTR